MDNEQIKRREFLRNLVALALTPLEPLANLAASIPLPPEKLNVREAAEELQQVLDWGGMYFNLVRHPLGKQLDPEPFAYQVGFIFKVLRNYQQWREKYQGLDREALVDMFESYGPNNPVLIKQFPATDMLKWLNNEHTAIDAAFRINFAAMRKVGNTVTHQYREELEASVKRALEKKGHTIYFPENHYETPDTLRWAGEGSLADLRHKLNQREFDH